MRFIYQNFSAAVNNKDLELTFSFLLEPDIKFSPQMTIKNAAATFNRVDRGVFDNLVFHLGLIESLSYWKAACPSLIEVRAGSLTHEQKTWWVNLIKRGMGEFFYQNKIDSRAEDFVTISGTEETRFEPKNLILSDRSVVFVGGGKDSAVSLEVIKQTEPESAAMIVNPTAAAEQMVKIAGIKEAIIISRQIDPKLLELNAAGYLNGHTPFSAYLAFLSLLVGYLFSFSNLVASNERSSDEPNTEYLGQAINHQFSKSWEFEQSFRSYVAKFISPSFNYFSLLRPLWEIQVSKIFARFPQYFSVFRSCNRGQKTNSWCGQCPKCLSVFVLLQPFLKEKTAAIFGKDLLADSSLKPVLEQLTDKSQPKPFECVGTRQEIAAALAGKTKSLLADWGEDKFLSQSLCLKLKTFV